MLVSLVQGSLFENHWSMRSPKSSVHTCTQKDGRGEKVASVVSNSVWPHRRQLTRLLRPWDSPGKNTGVAISFSNAWKWKVKAKSLSRVPLLATPQTAAYQAPPSMDFPGKSTGVGCHCLLWKSITVVYIFSCVFKKYHLPKKFMILKNIVF